MSIAPELWFRTILLRNGIRLEDEALTAVKRYLDALLRANRGVNLISRKDEEHAWSHHVLHCVSVLFVLRFPEVCRMLDLGSGGGLPGIPLRILLPTLKLTTLDATKKKVTAVKTILDELQLRDVNAVWGRAEELGRTDAFKEQFDVVIARAVGPLEELVRLAHPFLRKAANENERSEDSSGRLVLRRPCLVAYKGGNISTELEKARRIHYVRSVQTKPLVFEGSELMDLEDKKVVVVEFT